MSDAPTPHTEEKKPAETGIGPMVGTIIIVILFAIGGIYFLLQQKERLQQTPVETPVETPANS